MHKEMDLMLRRVVGAAAKLGQMENADELHEIILLTIALALEEGFDPA